MRLSAKVLVCIVVGTGLANAQTADTVRLKVGSSIAASQPAALAGLGDFKDLARGNPSKYGFPSANDAANAVLGGNPIVSFLVPVDRLRNYSANIDAITMLTGGDKVIYPVMLVRDVRSSMIVDKLPEGWKAVAFGGGQLIQRITQERDKVPAQNTTMLVEVAAPPALFFGEVRGYQFFLTPLIDQPNFRLRAGVSEPAARIFSRLAPAAKAYNGLPQ